MEGSITKITVHTSNTSKCVLATPIGQMRVECTEQGIKKCHITNEKPGRWPSSSERANQLLEKTVENLKQYFKNKRPIEKLPLDIDASDFNRKSWMELTKVPYGKTISYKQLAHKIKKPLAQRAIGGAMNKNPLMIIVPCHRVVKSDGTVGGFALDIKIKEWLLKHEEC